MIVQRVAAGVFLMVFGLAEASFAQPSFAQQSGTVAGESVVIHETKHDTGPLLREVAPLMPQYGAPSEHEIQNMDNPNRAWDRKSVKDATVQGPERALGAQTPPYDVEFDGIGYGDNFFCDCMPPDNDGAAGTTQYVQYVNLTYEVFSKGGTTLLGPLSGDDFWSGFGGSCQSDNSGDPIIRFDAAAQRWIVSQFALNESAPDYECVAISTTDDATGSYYRYAFPFKDFPDYPKVGVWPDAYYFSFNNYDITGTNFLGANVCAADRTNMLAGSAATMQCFQQNSSQFGMLPSDLDGANPPAAGTPNFFMELDPDGSDNLSMYAFHVDFVTPSNSTFTGPTQIAVPGFTPLCAGVSRNACVLQPTAGSDHLEGLSDRLMYRLVYRNFNDHTTLLVSHTVVAGSSGGVRWYEIHDPETTPTVYQSGTFAPDSQYRWMGAVAMDQNQDIAVGYSRSGSAAGDYPSLVYAGRVPGDPLGTLEGEVVLKAGEGSQSGDGYSRWGDYTSMTVDPTDDCTFWYTEEYMKATGQNGGFNWSTAIGSFNFPGCVSSGGSPAVTLSPTSLTFPNTVEGVTSGQKTVTVTNSGTVMLNISNLVASGDFAQKIVAKSCGSELAAGASCLVEITFTPGAVGALTGTLTITDNAANSPQTVGLSGNGTAETTLTPASKKFPTEAVGMSSPADVFTLSNKQKVELDSIVISTTGDFTVSATTCTGSLAAKTNCTISVVFAPTETGARTGTLNVSDSADGSPQISNLTGTGK